MSDDLILQARLELLLANLKRAQGVPELVESQRRDLARLLAIIGPERSTERSPSSITPVLKRSLKKVTVDLEDVATVDTTAKEALDRVHYALSQLDELQTRLDEAGVIVERLQQRRVLAAENLSRGTAVIELQSDAKNYIERVGELLGGEVAVQPGDPDLWQVYAELVDKIGPRFDECVDLLQGLSAREHGLEEASAALFELADTMIEPLRLSDFSSESFTIPSRHEVVAHGRINVLRMGFSEWTIWTLPLVAFEFGRLAVCRSHGIQSFIRNRHGDDVAAWENLIADSLATAALGPAYACAAIFLRLRPPREGDAADHDRMRMILLTLQKLNRNSAFDDVIQKLQETWKVASRATLAALPDIRQESELAAGVDFLFQQGANLLLVYPYEEYERAREMADTLMRAHLSQRDPDLSSADITDVRNLMNLAWLCRLEHPAASAAVAEYVLQLWTELLSQRRENSSATSGGFRRAAATSQRGGRI